MNECMEKVNYTVIHKNQTLFTLAKFMPKKGFGFLWLTVYNKKRWIISINA